MKIVNLKKVFPCNYNVPSGEIQTEELKLKLPSASLISVTDGPFGTDFKLDPSLLSRSCDNLLVPEDSPMPITLH